MLRLDKPARPGNRLKVKAGSSAVISHAGQETSDKGYGTGVGFFKNHLFGTATTVKKQHQPYSDDHSEETSSNSNGGRRLRGPSSAPQMEPNGGMNREGGKTGGGRVRGPSSAPQMEEPPITKLPSLSPGDVVMVGGLKARPDINRTQAIVSSYDPASGRYELLN